MSAAQAEHLEPSDEVTASTLLAIADNVTVNIGSVSGSRLA